MKRPRIVAISTAAPKPPAPLPEDVERLLPYTTDAYAPLTTPVNATHPPASTRVAPWFGFGVLVISSFATLGLAIATLSTRPRTPPAPQPVQAPAPRLRMDGNNTLNCRADKLTVFVADEGVGDGILIGTLSGTNASMVFTLGGTAGGYTADVTVDGGLLRSASAVRGQPIPVWPGEALLLKVDGVAEARRLLVTGGLSFGSREREVCQ